MPKVWIDALTAKQALIAGILSSELRRRGYECIITAREYDYTVSVLKMMGEEAIAYGRYGISREEKAVYTLERELYLIKYFVRYGKPDVHISLTSPDATHVAFKLGIPSVLLSDTPHSVYVNPLTIPLAKIVIIPSFIPLATYKRISELPEYVRFNGVFELMWIKRLRPDVKDIKRMDLEPFKYVVIRTEEKHASYYHAKYSEPTSIRDIISYIVSKYSQEIKVVVFPRYDDQRMYLMKLAREIGNIIIPRDVINPVSLYSYAIFVLTGGATMAVEASLLGTPSIITFPKELHVVKFLKERGFPIFQLSLNDSLSLIEEIMTNHRKWRRDTRDAIKELEDPLPLIIEQIEKITSS
ncbi:MAG: hypothetical protein DRJ66_01055 [Thermoprotei archaeon]|nr:MAG: hypothetical protein DRJ66_01055 [Thermoprotei archaeon]